MVTGHIVRSGVMAAGAVFAAGVALTPAHAADDIRQAITDGKVAIDLRYRYEYADDDAVSKDANASTLRTRFGYTTAAFYDFTAALEFEDITVVGTELYNSTLNGKTSYTVVQDPPLTEVNRALIQYDGLADNVFRGGRQRITLSNQRFVGNESWRQNEQTYDALSVVNTMLVDTELTYAFLTHVQTPTGVTMESKSHLFHGTYSGLPLGKIDGYMYLLDLDGTNDSSTLGGRFSGKQVYDQWTSLIYGVELAIQNDYADAPNSVDANYFAFEIGGDTSGITVMLGYEQLGGDGTYGFQTPLASKHGFNGWADMFLTTPAAGLEDLYGSVGTDIGTLKVLGVYHNFSPDSGGGDYGSELDFIVTQTFARRYDVGGKLAMYDADSFAADTLKMWLWVSTAF
ncbi:MAG: hypothetical protein FD165_1983 [Gammaproteobacteria bacterium]|nr:MAG: hypothetical protein FD165_1983 [Gammaproteobacteria bacterium]TND04976.1 MAG: hypothetical protein FD120_1254 [Gammaproteobacteria bacterium]